MEPRPMMDRLEAVFSIVPKARAIADIGTDHGYLAVELINRNRADFVIAGDVHKGPLESAKEYVKKRIYHIQHVNQTASELNKWIRKFNGVSTKYLQNYLNWFAISKLIQENQNPLKKTVLLIAGAFTAYSDYSKILDNYNMLIRL